MSVTITHLSFHDEGLFGVEGAHEILFSLERNPHVIKLTVSHNSLGDRGVEELAIGIRKLTQQGKIIKGIREINFASNLITDKGLQAIVENLLLLPPTSPTINPRLLWLYLGSNNIELSPNSPLPHLLSSALSQSFASLSCLSITSNPTLSVEGLKLFFRNLCSGSLTRICLNACGLNNEIVPEICQYLSDPSRSQALTTLELNGNSIDRASLTELAMPVLIGQNTSLCHFEVHANSDYEDRHQGLNEMTAQLEQKQDLALRESLTMALKRNRALHASAQNAALTLLPAARVLLNARAPPNTTTANATVSKDQFPFLRLPPELQKHILWCLAALKPVSLPNPHHKLSKSVRESLSTSSLSSYAQDVCKLQYTITPLSHTQFNSILNHASDKETLKPNYFPNEAQRSEFVRIGALTGDFQTPHHHNSLRPLNSYEHKPSWPFITKFLETVHCKHFENTH